MVSAAKMNLYLDNIVSPLDSTQFSVHHLPHQKPELAIIERLDHTVGIAEAFENADEVPVNMVGEDDGGDILPLDLIENEHPVGIAGDDQPELSLVQAHADTVRIRYRLYTISFEFENCGTDARKTLLVDNEYFFVIHKHWQGSKIDA